MNLWLKPSPRVAVEFEWMIHCHLPGVMAIERASHARPWTDEDLLAHTRDGTVSPVVALHADRVVGYSMHRNCAREIRLLNLAVAPDLRRRRVGSQLVGRLIGKLSPRYRVRIVADVRETNLPAQKFFRECGFFATGVLREHFRDPDEDGYRFAYGLDDVHHGQC